MASKVEQDLAYMLFRSSSTADLRKRLHSTLGNDFFSTAKTYNIKLKYAKNTIEEYYNELISSLKNMYFDSEGVMDQLLQICQTNGSLLFREELMGNLINNLDLPTERSNDLTNKIWNLFYSYEQTFDLMIEAQEVLEGMGEKVRGDKFLVAFGQEKNKKLEKISLITKEGYSLLLRNNRDLFNLNFNKDKKTGNFTLGQLSTNGTGIHNLQVREALTKVSSNFIIEDILDTKINANLTYREVWKELLSTKIFTNAYVQNNYLNYRTDGTRVQLYVTDARKQEILLSGAFSSATTLDQVKAIILNDFYSYDTGENISGFATGDANLALRLLDETKYLAIQSKLANGWNGWNGVSMDSLIDAFGFYGDEKLMFDIIDSNIDRANFNLINMYFKNTYGGEYDLSGNRMYNFIYQQMYPMMENTVDDYLDHLGAYMLNELESILSDYITLLV